MTLFSDVLSIPSNPEDFFTLISLIGSGAFGHVYKAIHNESKKIYAIKIIQYFKEDINYIDNNNHIDNINFCYKTVQQETSLMRLVNSSNYILKYYGSYFSRKTNTLWLIIEYCSYGSTIDLMLAMDRNYTEIELSTIIKMILNGLIIIHNKNLLHRDIKGANILLSEEGFAKLGDFGVGVELKEKFRNSKKGSPYWMSPQVIKQEKYDYKTDIWSLGITCIELLQGDPPYSTLSPEEVMKKIGNKMFKFEDFFGGEKNKYSKEFQNFLSRCLDVNPKKRADAKELIKHPFILKYAKDNLFLKKILIKHKNDIEIYRKELEEFENQLKNNKKNKDGVKININNSLNTTVKKDDFFNDSKNNSKKKKILESIKKKEKNYDKEFNENNSFFKYINIRNNVILPINCNLLSNLSSNNEITKRKSDLNTSKDLNIPNMNLSINNSKRNTINFEKKLKIKNNSFISSYRNNTTKSRNLEENITKELKNKNKLYLTKNEYMIEKNKKCQIISFRMSMKKSTSEKKNNNELKKNNIIYNKKIILDQGKHKKHYNNEINKINSYKNIISTNSNINTDFNTDNFSTTNNNHSFIMNSLSLKHIFNKTIKNENIKNLKNKIHTLSHIKNNNIDYENNNLYNVITTDYNINRISTEANNISHIEQIPSLNLDKILNNNNIVQKSKNIDCKEENIFDNDDDGTINKINNYNLNVKDFQNKENINKLNFYQNNNDTIHSYSILDSKDSVISIMPIHSTNKNLDETHRKYFL